MFSKKAQQHNMSIEKAQQQKYVNQKGTATKICSSKKHSNEYIFVSIAKKAQEQNYYILEQTLQFK